MDKYKEYNKGYKNFLLVIDIFFCFVFICVLKNNIGKDIKLVF